MRRNFPFNLHPEARHIHDVSSFNPPVLERPLADDSSRHLGLDSAENPRKQADGFRSMALFLRPIASSTAAQCSRACKTQLTCGVRCCANVGVGTGEGADRRGDRPGDPQTRPPISRQLEQLCMKLSRRWHRCKADEDETNEACERKSSSDQQSSFSIRAPHACATHKVQQQKF